MGTDENRCENRGVMGVYRGTLLKALSFGYLLATFMGAGPAEAHTTYDFEAAGFQSGRSANNWTDGTWKYQEFLDGVSVAVGHGSVEATGPAEILIGAKGPVDEFRLSRKDRGKFNFEGLSISSQYPCFAKERENGAVTPQCEDWDKVTVTGFRDGVAVTSAEMTLDCRDFHKFSAFPMANVDEVRFVAKSPWGMRFQFEDFAFNRAPLAANSAIGAIEDQSYIFAAADFQYADEDGDAMRSVRVTSLPSAGMLMYAGAQVTSAADITAADLSAGKLVFKPAADANGAGYASFGFKVHDGHVTSAAGYQMTVNVAAVNDAPSFTRGADQAIDEDAGAQVVPGWATLVSPGGGADEATQAVNFTVTHDNATLFAAPPAIGADGTLTYTTAPNAHGSATVTVLLGDDGGTDNGGVNNGALQTFAIVVAPVNDAPYVISAPAIQGAPVMGGTLSAGAMFGDVEGNSVSLLFQWQRSADGESFADVPGATGAGYAITPADAHAYLRVLVAASDGFPGGTTLLASAAVQLANTAPAFTGAPVVNGEPRVGQTLAVANVAAADPDGDRLRFSYQWQSSADGSSFDDVPGATGASFPVPASQAHRHVRVTVVADDGQSANHSASVTSPAVQLGNTAPAFSGTPALSGIAKVGQTLSTANTETSDADGDTVTVSLQWQRSADGTTFSDVAGATNGSYELTSADAHQYVRYVARADDGQSMDNSASATSAAVQLSNTAPVFGTAPAVTGTAKVGQTVTVTGAEASDADGDRLTLRYQWQVSADGRLFSDIAGGTDEAYALTVAEAHRYVRCVVTANDGQANDASAAAESTAVQLANTAPRFTRRLVVTGSPRMGESLRATGTETADADGDRVVVRFQWQRSSDGVHFTNIAGATGSAYVLATDDLHRYVRFTATALDGQSTDNFAWAAANSVNMANLSPVAGGDTVLTDVATSVIVAVLANDADPDGDALTLAAISSSANGGTLVNNGDGTITYTGATGYSGTDTFSYTVADGYGGSATGNVTVYVYPAMGAKDGRGRDLGTGVNVANSFSFRPSGGSGDYLVTVAANAAGTNGTLVLNADGSYTFKRPTAGAFAGNYLMTLMDKLTGASYEVMITVPLAVSVGRPDLLGLGGTATVTVRGASAGMSLRLGVVDEDNAEKTGVLANVDATATATDDYAGGNPATATVSAINLATDTAIRVTAVNLDLSGASALVTIVAADTFSGNVVDEANGPIAGATVVADGLRDGLNQAYGVKTDASGQFALFAPKSTARVVAGAASRVAQGAAAGSCLGTAYPCTFALGAAGSTGFPGASGSVKVNHVATHVSTSLGVTPVVIAGVPSYNGWDPGVARISNVTNGGFDLRFAEWEYLDRIHDNPENIAWAALAPGRHVLADGSVWEAGVFKVAGTGVFQPVAFTTPFAGTPRLFLTIQSEWPGGELVTVRARSVTREGFQVALFEEQAKMNGHGNEFVGYLAIYTPMESGRVFLGGSPIDYTLDGAQLDSTFRDVLDGYYEIFLQEDLSNDSESVHPFESVDLLMLGSGLFGQDVSARGWDTIGLRYK